MKEFMIPEGMRDLVIEETQTKRQLQIKLEDCLQRWGYDEIETPTIEYYKTYHTGFDDLQEEQLYKFFDSQGRILTLRADMTIPIARFVATKYKNTERPIRLRYCANVFKVHEALSGNRNEICDLGVELIATNKKEGDLEILCVAMDTLSCIESENLTLEIGDVNFFRRACELIGLNQEATYQLAYYIDNKRLPELEEFLVNIKLDTMYQEFFKQMVWWNGDIQVLDEALAYAFHEDLVAIILYLKELYYDLSSLDNEERITFDLGKIGKLNYYTGIIFDAFVEGVGLRVMSGGRYDTLLSKYGSDVAAVGFSIKLDQIIPVIEHPVQESVCIEYGKGMLLDALKLRKDIHTSKVIILKENERSNEVVLKGDIE